MVCNSGVTDHDTVLIGIENSIKNNNNPSSPKLVTKTDYAEVIVNLESINWESFYRETDVTLASEFLIYNIGLAVQKNTVKKKIRCSDVITKPWMTPKLVNCARQRDALHLKAKKFPEDQALQNKYKRFRNHFNSMLKTEKNYYESDLIATNKNNSKKLWNTVKDICNIKKSKSDYNELLNIRSNPMDSLNAVNDYFSSVGQNLAQNTLSQLQTSELQLTDSISVNASPSNSLFLTPTDEFEITKIISGLKTASAPGSDMISNELLKRASHILASPIAHICNLSMSQGVVPNCFKIADICPIFKTGNKTAVSNYRPISLLPSLSKILEKVVNKRLLGFLESNNMLSSNQYGFRSGKSTEDAVVALVDHVTDCLDRSQKCIGVFLDLAKAFDTVSWPMLLRKLELYGVRGSTLDWFRSYLCDRKQRVRAAPFHSDYVSISFGVPQGSVLGPTLFLVYINDLCQLKINQAKFFTFADDTALVFQGKNWNEVSAVAQQGLSEVAHWLQSNLLSLNATKTKYIAFCITQRTYPSTINLKLHTCSANSNQPCSCPELMRVNTLKYLGVAIDHRLNWECHIKNLCTQLRKMSHVFKRLGSVADPNTLKIVYHAFCQSILSYCIACWGSANKTLFMKIERAQRFILKVAYKKPYLYPTVQLYNDTKYLTVRQLYIHAVILRFHKTASSTIIPPTRSARRNVWTIPLTRTTFAQRSNYFKGPLLYQHLDNSLDILKTSRFVCKRKITGWLTSLDQCATENVLKITK